MSSWNRPGGSLAAVLAATLGGWLVAAATPRDYTAGTFSDDAQYAVLAQALRERHTYRSIHIPGAPPEIKYPPAWPAVLALAWKPGAGAAANLERLQRVNFLLVGPLAGLLALAALRVFGLSPGAAALGALAGVAAPAVLTWWTLPLSEPLCLALLALGLVLAQRERWRGAALALVAAVYVRSLAAPFLVALLAVSVWRLGWRRAAQPLAIGIGLLLPWALYVLLRGAAFPHVLTAAAHGSYAAWYAQSLAADPATVLIAVPLTNLPLLVRELGRALLAWGWAPAAIEIAIGLAIVGLVSRTAWRLPVFGLGLALYAVIVLLWPFPGADRFVGSVWPLLLAAMLAAIPSGGSRSAERGLRVAAGWLRPGLLAAVSVLVAIAFLGDAGVERHRQRSASAVAFVDSLRPRIPRDAVVASTNPALTYLLLGNPAVPAYSYRTYRWYRAGFWATSWGLADDLWDIIRVYRPGYIMIERRGAEGRYAAGSLMRQCPGVLSPVWRSPGDELLVAVHPDVPCSPERSAR